MIHAFDSHFTHIHVIDAYTRDSRMGKEGDEQIEETWESDVYVYSPIAHGVHVWKWGHAFKCIFANSLNID